MKKIPYGKQFIDTKDILAVKNSLNEELITTGKNVEKFEKEFVKFTKSKFAISCNSGTSALHLALSSIDLKVAFLTFGFSQNFNAESSFSLPDFLSLES